MTTYTDRQKACTPFDFLAHLQRQREWSERTFGPGSRAKGVVDHIRKELREIEADPTDLMEWIDVVILALDGAWRAGGSPQQIIDTIVAKQTKNEGRTWPDWRTMPADKAIEHDRSGESTSPVAGFSEATQDEREFHEAVVSLVRDMMNAMQNEHFWSDVPELHVRVNALLTAPLPRAVASQPGAPAEPIPMLLFCPNCGEQHIDAPEPADADIDVDGSVISATSAWDNPPHRSHLCHACGAVWRPADVPTTGVASIATKGKADTWDGVESFFEPDVGEFKWPRLPDFPQSFAHVAGHAYFTEHQMQGYANAYGEIVRATLAAAKPVSVDAGGMTYPAEFTEDLEWILGLICFQCIEYARALRKGGRDIPTKAEAEQAHTLDWLLRHYMRDPTNWRKNAADEARSFTTPPTESTGEPK